MRNYKNVLIKIGKYIYRGTGESGYNDRHYFVCINDPADWTWVRECDINTFYTIVGKIT